ncbi:MAG TPA: hypothetical protein VJ862_11215 [Rhodanobacteraceae bacterium]|nr:hypothetical protein [Rhodanobacteraceae bacterium]
MHIARMTGLATLLLAMIQVAAAQQPSAWQEQQLDAISKSDAIMKRVGHYKGLLAQYQVMRRAYAADSEPAFRTIFGQYLSWYQTFIGDYKDAETAFSIPQLPLRDDTPSPLTIPGEHPVQAATYIPELAKNYRVVFLNEAHNLALTRTLTVRLLRRLREEGFNTFAVETLDRKDMAALAKRGYPTVVSGYYTREPIYAEMVRTALTLGYKVVAYEADGDRTGDAREAQQAENLWKILKDDPAARLVVNAGYEHIQKLGKFLGVQSMAEHFVEDSGIVPLSVEQTILIPHQDRSMDHPDYDAIINAVHTTQPIVFLGKNGKPWSLRPGYDVSVVFPEEHFRLGRPTWLSLLGIRVAYPVHGTVCRGHYPCMVSARYDDERDDAIPADRMVLEPISEMTIDGIRVTSGEVSTLRGELYLRPGRYRLFATDQNGALLMRQTISVPQSRDGGN